MKKIYSILCLLVILTFAQNKVNAQSFNGGIKAGATFTQVDGDGMSGFHKAGFTGGGFINYSFTEQVILQGELLFSMKGSRASSKQKQIGDDLQINANYFDIPILVGFQIYKNFWMLGGIMPSVLVTGDETINGQPRVDSPGFSDFDCSFAAAFNYRFWKNLSASFTWTYSFLNIRDGVQNGYSQFLWFRYWGEFNNVFALTLQYHFR